MKSLLIEFLICPTCLPQENKLFCNIIEEDRGEILSGSLRCRQCGTVYPVQEGIGFLLPRTYPSEKEAYSRYERSSVVSSYLWSHYADLLIDMDASTAYQEWAELLGYNSGFSIDTGCAVGRFTFEMSKKSDFSVGVDNSHSFIRKARDLMINRQLDITLPREGLLTEHKTINLPETLRGGKVEFIVGDVQVLPFRKNFFANLASLNLIDKIPSPLTHLREINRIAKRNDAQFLFSDPFSWSSDIASEEHWLGGTSDGPYSGSGIDNILSLLTGKNDELIPPWRIEKKGHVWWKIRTHQNHFELIRSCFVKARR